MFDRAATKFVETFWPHEIARGAKLTGIRYTTLRKAKIVMALWGVWAGALIAVVFSIGWNS